MRYSDEVLCAGGVASSHEDRNEPLGRLSMMPLRRVAHQGVPGQLPMNGERCIPCVQLRGRCCSNGRAGNLSNYHAQMILPILHIGG